MSRKFDGRVALVTGATSGIGRAAAIAFARDGARVMITGRNRARGAAVLDELRKAGGEAEFVPSDLGDPAAAGVVVRATVEHFGRLDFAVNNASEVAGARFLEETEDAEFERAVAVNLRSVWFGLKHEITQMLAQDPPGGAIVNTASVNALGGVPQSALYAMTKAGVIALTKSAALECAARAIRINALVPGAFYTPMLEAVIDRLSSGDPVQRAAVEERYREFIPMARVGTPDEAARAILWLCSDDASYVTGHSLIVDGGMTAPFR